MRRQGDGFIWMIFYFFCTLTTDVSSYEISFINVTEQMKAAGKRQQQIKAHDEKL